MQVHGSGSLVRSLLDNQLVDGITLLTYPVVIGQGTRLIPDTGPTQHLNWSARVPPPAGLQVYRRTGRPKYATATTQST